MHACACVLILARKVNHYLRYKDIRAHIFTKKSASGHLLQRSGRTEYMVLILPVHAVISTQMKQGKEVNETVIVDVKVAVLIGLMLE